ncbi:hypothetical protein JCM11251_000255 [Rhodosporidiobolus azoricus]
MRTQSASAGAKRSGDARWRPGGTLGKHNSAKRGGSRRGGGAAGRDGYKADSRVGETEPRRKDKEVEWSGIPSEEVNSGDEDEKEVELSGGEDDEADPAMEEDDEPVAAPATAGSKGPKHRKKKASGPGKQKKVFVEEKSDLLSLVASIAGQHEAKTRAKLQKTKQRPAKAPPVPKDQVNPAKQKQLDAARAVVAARTKAKKDQQKVDSAPKPALAPASEGKKRVSFA